MRIETLTFTDHDGITKNAVAYMPEDLVFADTRDVLFRVKLSSAEMGRGIKLAITGDAPKTFTTSETLQTDATGSVVFNLSRMLQLYLDDIMADEMFTTYDGHGDANQRWQRIRPDWFVSFALYYIDGGDRNMNLATTRCDVVHGCNAYGRAWRTQRPAMVYLYYPTEIDVCNAASSPTGAKVNGSSVTPVAINQLTDANLQTPVLKRWNILDYFVESGFVTQVTDRFWVQLPGAAVIDDDLDTAQKDIHDVDLRYCTQRDGVFLRWIGTDGCICHYLFDDIATTIATKATEHASTYLNAIRFGELAVKMEQDVAHYTAERTHSIGVQFADEDTARMVSTLATSPCVEMMVSCKYNGDDIRDVVGGLVTAYSDNDLSKLETRWKRVKVKAGSLTIAKKDTIHAIGLEIVEPNMETI